MLLFIDRYFPTNEPFIEVVYSKLIPKRNFKVYSIMRDTEAEKFLQIKKWNHSVVVAYKFPYKRGILLEFIVNIRILLSVMILVKRIKPDILQVRNWVWGLFLGVLFKQKLRKPLYFQYTFPFDLNFKQRIKSGNLKNKIKYGFILLCQNILMRFPDYIISISGEMKRELINQGYKPDKIIPLGLAFDDKLLENDYTESTSRVISEHELRNKKIVLYFGAMDKNRNLEFLLDVWSKVVENEKNAVLLMVGGDEKEIMNLSTYSKNINCSDNIIFTGKVARNNIPSYILASHFSLSPIPNIPLYRVSSVTKLFESLGFGCPVIATDLPEQKKIVDESNGGICVQFQQDQFINAINYLLRNPQHAKKMGYSARDYVLKNRTYSHLTETICNYYSKSLENN